MTNKKFKIIFGIIGLLVLIYNVVLAFICSSFEFSITYIILAVLSVIVFTLIIFCREKDYTTMEDHKNNDLFLYDRINKLKLQLEVTNNKLDEANNVIELLRKKHNKN